LKGMISRKTRLGKYIDTRILKHMNANFDEPLFTEDLIQEIERYILGKRQKIKAGSLFHQRVVKYIEQSRHRARRNAFYLRQQKKLWAKDLGLTIEQMDVLVNKGLVRSKPEVGRLLRILEVMGRNGTQVG